MDIQFFDLWLPVVVATAACFVASSVLWMALPHHKPDIKPLPDEKAFTDALARLDLPPGFYMWPNCQNGESMSSTEFQTRFAAGPWGSVNILAAKPNFLRNLAVNFLEHFLIAFFVAYIASQALGVGADSSSIIRVVFTAGLLGYVLGLWSGAAFMGTRLRFALTNAFDGVVYAAVLTAAFVFLWPAADAALPAVP